MKEQPKTGIRDRWNKHAHALFTPFLHYFRSRRKRLFFQLINPDVKERILDVGGYHWFWIGMGCGNPVTCLNIAMPKLDESVPERYQYVVADGRALPYPDDRVELVFSNSVIEHRGSYEEQQRFASEIRRVGKSYWVQTPNRWFPVEPHLLTPFIHYLPRGIQRYLIRWFTIGGLVIRPSRERVDAFLRNVRLLTEQEMKELFPDSTIICERFLGLKKSFIAVKRHKDPGVGVHPVNCDEA